MNTRRKYVLILVLLLGGGLLVWWLWRSAESDETSKPQSQLAPSLAAHGSIPQVAAPTLAPVVAHSSARTFTPGSVDPQASVELNVTIAQAIDQLKAKNIPGLMHTVMQPGMWDEWRAEMLHNGDIQTVMPMMSEVYLRSMLTPEQLRQVMQQQGIPVNEKLIASYTHYSKPDQAQAQFLGELQSILNQPPELAPDGVHARYPLSIEGDRTSVLFFEKVNGLWYLQN